MKTFFFFSFDYECFIMISSVSVLRLEERKLSVLRSELLKMNQGLKNSLSNLLK